MLQGMPYSPVKFTEAPDAQLMFAGDAVLENCTNVVA